MATPYSDVINSFLPKVKDYDLLKYQEMEREEIVIRLMLKSCVKFSRVCKVDLTDRDDNLKQFNGDLDDEIIDIITEGMIVEWLKPRVYSSENLKNVLNTKDYNQYSPANLLKELRETYQLSKKAYKSLINNYSFANADFTKLGG